MATPAARTRLTPEEYIAFERKALPDAEIIRHEYQYLRQKELNK